jgi:DNA repair exonuclease SbcCD ATPase subunit
VLSRAHQAL